MKKVIKSFSVVLVVAAVLMLLASPAYSFRGGYGHGYYGGGRGYYGGWGGRYWGGGGYPYWGWGAWGYPYYGYGYPSYGYGYPYYGYSYYSGYPVYRHYYSRSTRVVRQQPRQPVPAYKQDRN